MRIAILGSGAVGGYFGAKLARAGHDVTFIARGAHRDAIRARGLSVRSPHGDFLVRAPAEDDPRKVGVVDLVLFAVKTYDDDTALPLLRPLTGAQTTVLPLQNGVEAAEHVAAIVGAERTLGATTYIGTALEAPGVIVQTGLYHRIVMGEWWGTGDRVSARVARLGEALAGADIEVELAADARVPVWEKFIYLAPMGGLAAAARQPAGVIWNDPALRAQFLAGVQEVEAVARAEGLAVAANMAERVTAYMGGVAPEMRPSMLLDLTAGKPLELEALQGAVVRRGAARGVPTPVMATLYAVLKPHAAGRSGQADA
jgi:2-dehydropantoate 2-reductase